MRFEDLAHAAVDLCGDLMGGPAATLGEAATIDELGVKGRLAGSIASSLQGSDALAAFEARPTDGAVREGFAHQLEGVLEDDANMVAELLVALGYLPSQSGQTVEVSDIRA